MEYKGKLYGKVDKNYFPLIKTTDDFEALENENQTRLNIIDFVKEFHHKFNAPVLPFPQLIDYERWSLRLSLINEEFKELKDGCYNADLVEIIDALCDLQYVLIGAVLEFGIQDIFQQCLNEVHRSNMSKACKTEDEAIETAEKYYTDGVITTYTKRDDLYFVERLSDGKALKSINYSPVDISGILLATGNYVEVLKGYYLTKDVERKQAIQINGRFYALKSDVE